MTFWAVKRILPVSSVFFFTHVIRTVCSMSIHVYCMWKFWSTVPSKPIIWCHHLTQDLMLLSLLTAMIPYINLKD
jgi:hypothetical protein